MFIFPGESQFQEQIPYLASQGIQGPLGRNPWVPHDRRMFAYYEEQRLRSPFAPQPSEFSCGGPRELDMCRALPLFQPDEQMMPFYQGSMLGRPMMPEEAAMYPRALFSPIDPKALSAQYLKLFHASDPSQGRSTNINQSMLRHLEQQWVPPRM